MDGLFGSHLVRVSISQNIWLGLARGYEGDREGEVREGEGQWLWVESWEGVCSGEERDATYYTLLDTERRATLNNKAIKLPWKFFIFRAGASRLLT